MGFCFWFYHVSVLEEGVLGDVAVGAGHELNQDGLLCRVWVDCYFGEMVIIKLIVIDRRL